MNLLLKKQAMGTLLVFAGLFNQLNANYCAKCTKIETERAQEQAQEGYKKIEYFEDYKKPIHLEDDPSSSSIKSESKALNDDKIREQAFLDLQQTSQWLAALVNEKSIQASSLQSDRNFSDKGQTEVAGQDPLKPGKNGQNTPHAKQNSSELFNSGDSQSTIADVLSIQNFMEIFEKPFTILAPSDEAIRNFPEPAFRKILESENRELLFSYLTNHVIPHQIFRQDFNKPFKTLGGRIIEFSNSDKGLTVNDNAKVLKSVHLGNHGILYVIDRVLIPIHD